MATEKFAWTEETANMAASMYDGTAPDDERKQQVEEIASKLGVSARAVISKLASMRLYVKPTYKTATGERPESKADIVEDIAQAMGEDSERLESLEKANKHVLRSLRERLSGE